MHANDSFRLCSLSLPSHHAITQDKFDSECYYNSPDWVIAAEAACSLNCTGRCPGGSDAECPASTVCVVQADGNRAGSLLLLPLLLPW